MTNLPPPVANSEAIAFLEHAFRNISLPPLSNDDVDEIADSLRFRFRPIFQQRVQPWLLECFGETIAGDREQRNHRFLEEALELVQATGCTAGEAHQLVAYVYGRPAGDSAQEVGGVMVTLAALCLANDLDMNGAAETELERVWTKVEAIRAKHAAKPKHSPLPEAPAAARHGDWQWWSGTSDEWYSNGPCTTREAALAALDGAPGYLVEARPADPVRMSAERLLEDQYFENNDDFDFDHAEPDRLGPPEVIEAADTELQALLNGWCTRHAHTFARGNLFGDTRNIERVNDTPAVVGP